MNSPERRMKVVAILALLATPCYIICFLEHVCMAGHMHHPPYSLWQWINDFFWIICFSAVIVFSIKTKKLCEIFGI